MRATWAHLAIDPIGRPATHQHLALPDRAWSSPNGVGGELTIRAEDLHEQMAPSEIAARRQLWGEGDAALQISSDELIGTQQKLALLQQHTKPASQALLRQQRLQSNCKQHQAQTAGQKQLQK